MYPFPTQRRNWFFQGLGTEEGGAFPIHNRMYEAIASSDIIICDLSGHRPNVFVEAGYALKHHEKNRLIFLFEPRNRNDKMPFDLTTFKYVPISQAAEIPNTIKSEIIAILRDAGAAIQTVPITVRRKRR